MRLLKGLLETEQMEDIETFEKWLADLIRDGRKKLHMTNKILAHIFLREGLSFFHKHLLECEMTNKLIRRGF